MPAKQTTIVRHIEVASKQSTVVQFACSLCELSRFQGLDIAHHGFLLDENGWKLSPAFDVNPTHYGNGLTLNISETDNAQDLELALQVAPDFRIQHKRSKEIITDIINSVSRWKKVAKEVGIGNSEVEGMKNGFRLVGR